LSSAIVELEPGEMAYVRRGIAHRMNGGKAFSVGFSTPGSFYIRRLSTAAGRHSTFEVQ
jgi:hypothetical protein